MSTYSSNKNTIIHIVGAGPAGLFSCLKLLQFGFRVNLYDQMPSAGRKFLIAGHSGLNITHGEETSSLIQRYTDKAEIIGPMITRFDSKELINWCHELGVETFKGSSGRVFPVKMKAAEMLKLWMDEIKKFEGFKFFPNYKLKGLAERLLLFEQEKIDYEVAILALGGASWPQTGSDGKWFEFINKINIPLKPFSPVNVGLIIDHQMNIGSEQIYLKDVVINLSHHSARGDVMITDYGIESGPVYLIGIHFDHYPIEVEFDLLPNWDKSEILKCLEERSNKVSLSNFLRKKFKLSKEKSDFLKAFTSKSEMLDNHKLANKLKHLNVLIKGTRSIEEAISIDGGVCFNGLNDQLESKEFKGLYFAGEMLDWKAPTGGYLLQACFSTAFRVVESISSNYK